MSPVMTRKLMRADGLLRRIPICVVSAESGSLPPATRVIPKKFEVRALLEAIDEALNQKCPNQCAA